MDTIMTLAMVMYVRVYCATPRSNTKSKFFVTAFVLKTPCPCPCPRGAYAVIFLNKKSKEI